MRQRHVACPGDRGLRPVVSAALSTTQTPHTLDQIVERLPRLARIDWQSYQAFGHGLRHGELTFAKTSGLKCSGVVQRCVVRSNFDATFVKHRVDEIILRPSEFLRLNLNRIKMKYVFAAGLHRRKRYTGKIT